MGRAYNHEKRPLRETATPSCGGRQRGDHTVMLTFLAMVKSTSRRRADERRADERQSGISKSIRSGQRGTRRLARAGADRPVRLFHLRVQVVGGHRVGNVREEGEIFLREQL